MSTTFQSTGRRAISTVMRTKTPSVADIIALAEDMRAEGRPYSLKEPCFYPPLPYKVKRGEHVNCSSFAFRLLIEAYGITPKLYQHRMFHVASGNVWGPLIVAGWWHITMPSRGPNKRKGPSVIALHQAWVDAQKPELGGHTFLSVEGRSLIIDASPNGGVRVREPWPWRSRKWQHMDFVELDTTDGKEVKA